VEQVLAVGWWCRHLWGRRCIHTYVKAKMILVETFLGIRGGEKGERSGEGNSSMMYLIHCKNLCNYFALISNFVVERV
jgi:hypothetical protein